MGRRNLLTYVKDVCMVSKVMMHKTGKNQSLAIEMGTVIVVEKDVDTKKLLSMCPMNECF